MREISLETKVVYSSRFEKITWNKLKHTKKNLRPTSNLFTLNGVRRVIFAYISFYANLVIKLFQFP